LLFYSCFFFGIQSAYCQILVTNNAPYNTAEYLVDSLLLGEGVIATNHAFQGDPLQIGFFNGVNSNIGFDNFTVKVQSDEISSDEYTFSLLDSRGRVLREIVFDGIVQVNRENLAKGVYIIQISSERVSHQQKIIFE
tara:strand:- start:60 stop:470 length:411 start_codon:yes stop_codon:yes gene_type:complete